MSSVGLSRKKRRKKKTTDHPAKIILPPDPRDLRVGSYRSWRLLTWASS
jgi:hypothetical protein